MASPSFRRKRYALFLAFRDCIDRRLTTPVIAWSDLDSMKLSTALGDVLPSERPCGLTCKQDAIAKFIDSKVSATDMNFTSDLDVQTKGHAIMLKDMSESSKTAHCRQIERVAKSYGFI
jgi:hypothetical protein